MTMEMNEARYDRHRDEYDGYCKECDDITNYGEVEPDARNYQCDDCGKRKVMGIEEALMAGFIKIIDDEGDDEF